MLGVFVALEIVAFLLIFFFVPETSGTAIGRLDDSLTYMSLEELNYIFRVPTFVHSKYQLTVMLPWSWHKAKWITCRWFMKVDDPGEPELLYRWAEHQLEDYSSENSEERPHRRRSDGWERPERWTLPPPDLPQVSLMVALAREQDRE